MIPPNNEIVPILYFNDPEQAEAPLSANTEYTMCIELCDGTYESQNTPHPTYTNEFGKAVVQLNMVALGGTNGLNS